MKPGTNFVVYFYSFWPTARSCADYNFRLTKLVLAKTSNKGPFLKAEVLGAYLRVGAYSRGRLFNNFRLGGLPGGTPYW